jgi:PKD repeat protein
MPKLKLLGRLFLFLFVLSLFSLRSFAQGGASCEEAMEVVVNEYGDCDADIYDINLNGATTSPELPRPACGGFTVNTRVRWVKFTVPDNVTKLNLSISRVITNPLDISQQAWAMNMAVYKGANCNSLSQIGCYQSTVITFPIAIATDPVSAVIQNLVPGETIYVRIWERSNRAISAKFGISRTTDPPINDRCENAIPLTTSGCNYLAAGNDMTAPDACGWTSTDNSIFFTFEVTSITPRPVQIIIDNVRCTGGGGNIQLAVYRFDGNCNNIGGSGSNYHGCASGTGRVVLTTTPGNLPNGRYILAVDGESGSNCSFGISGTVMQEPPQARFNAPTNICAGACLNFRDDSFGGPTAWEWKFEGATPDTSNQKDPQNICFNTPGSYRVTLRARNANGSTAVSRIINVSPPLDVSAGPDVQICSGGNVQLNGAVLGGRAPFTYSWSPAATLTGANTASPTARPIANTTYTLQVTDAGGCRGTSAVTVRVVSGNLAVRSGNDTVLCQPAQFRLNPIVTGGSGNYTYAWRPAALLDNPAVANPLATVNGTTTFILTVDDGNCTQSHQFTATLPTPMTVNITPNGPICGGSNQRITAVVNGGTAPFVYSWQPEEGLSSLTVNNPIVNPTQSVIYTVLVTDSRGCAQSQTINVNPTPGVPPTTPIVLCQAGVARFTAQMGAPAGTEMRLYTQSSGGNPISTAVSFPYELTTPMVNAPTTLYLEAAASGCVSPRSLVTISLQPSITASANYARCAAPTTTVTFAASTLPGASYLWSGPGGFISNLQNPVLNNVTSSASGEYTVEVTAPGCPPLVASTSVTIFNTPTFLLASSNSPVCVGGKLMLTGIVTEPGSAFHWQGPAGFRSVLNNPELNNMQPGNAGNYEVYAVANNCTSSVSIVPVSVTNAVTPVVENPFIERCGPGIVGYTILLPPNYRATLFDGATPLGQAVTPPYIIYYNAEQSNNRLSIVGQSPEGCLGNPAPVAVVINPIPGLPSATVINRCGVGPAVFTAQMGNPAGSELRLYSMPDDNQFVSRSAGPIFELTTPNLTQNTTFYLESYIAPNCKSEKVPVAANLILPPTPTVVSPITRCQAGPVTLSFLATGALVFQLWDSETGGSLLANIPGNQTSYTLPFVSQSTTYWLAAQNEQRCEGLRIPIKAIVETPEAPKVEPVARCGKGRVVFTVSYPGEGQVLFYENENGGLPTDSQTGSPVFFATPELEESASYYIAFRTPSGCESRRALALARVQPIPGLPSVSSTNRCGIGFLTLTAQMGNPAGDELLLYDLNENIIGSSSQFPWVFDLFADGQLQVSLRSRKNNTGCLSLPLLIAPNVIPVPQNPVLPDVGRCGGGRVVITFSANEPSGVVFGLYDSFDALQPVSTTTVTAENQGNLRLTTPLIQTTTTFYLQAQNQGCFGNRVPVPVRIFNLLNVTPIITPDDGSGNGTCRLEVVGGFAPYTFVLGSVTQSSDLFTGLSAGVYNIRISDSQNCVATLRIEIPLAPAICPTPETLKVNVTQEGKLMASWLPVPGASRYELSYRIVGEIEWSPVFTTTVPSFVFTALQPETEYELRVRTFCETTPSEWALINFTTPICNAVNFIWTTGVTENEAIANWSAMEGATGYEFTYRPQNALFWQPERILPTMRWPLTNLVRGATYEIRVRTLCLGGSVVADYVYNAFTTLKCDPVEDITAFNLTETSAQLSWRAVPDASAFRVSYARKDRDDWQTILVSEPRAVLSGLFAGENYNVRIQTLCQTVEGQFSQSTFITRAASNICPVPQSLQARNITSTSAELSWLAVPQANSYQVRYRPENGIWSAQTINLPFVMSNLEPARRYFYQVRSVCSFGNSDWSLERNFQTISARAAKNAGNVSQELVLYPNPNNGRFTLLLPFEEAQPNILELKIYSLEGQLIGTYSIQPELNHSEAFIELPMLPEGFYLARLQLNEAEECIAKIMIKY